MSTARKTAVATMIEEILEMGCVLEFDGKEVTLFQTARKNGPHFHFSGETLYDRLVLALETARSCGPY